MEVCIKDNPVELGRAAGKVAADLIKNAIKKNGQVNIILATGISQFETLKQLISESGIDWGKVVMFHLDEYIGLPESSPASFRKYLKERFLEKVPPLKASHLVDGNSDPVAECGRLCRIIKEHPIDVALVGIGENGHLAFNDPPADFDTEEPFIIVNLEDQCRKQQFNEGWFDAIDDVPQQAISMSIRQILKSKHIVCSVPDSRKATAVKNCLEQPISNLFPGSILQSHPNCSYFLDKSSAAYLIKEQSPN
ncbi:MAG TPA: glucosamine-6-phosphate deaminase [Puia sp.]|nr:glucosamine-6-phosphate deaminase [Puia sp.]